MRALIQSGQLLPLLLACSGDRAGSPAGSDSVFHSKSSPVHVPTSGFFPGRGMNAQKPTTCEAYRDAKDNDILHNPAELNSHIVVTNAVADQTPVLVFLLTALSPYCNVLKSNFTILYTCAQQLLLD